MIDRGYDRLRAVLVLLSVLNKRNSKRNFRLKLWGTFSIAKL